MYVYRIYRISRRTCAYQGCDVRMTCAYDVLCFLETPVLRFALSPYYRRIDQTRLVNCWKYLLQILEEFHQRWNFPICINAVDEKLIWDHLFSTCAKFSTKLTFLTPCTCTYQGVRNVSLSENFAYVLKDWPRGSKNSGFSYKN